MRQRIHYLEIDSLEPSPFNPPDRVRPENIKGLIEGIREAGEIMEPILVARNSDHYIIVNGHRRVAAAKELGIEYIPSIVKDADPEWMWKLANEYTKPISGVQWMQTYHLGFSPDKIPYHFRSSIIKLRQVVGDDMFADLCRRGRSPYLYTHAKSVARYCDEDNYTFIRKVIVWFETHRQQFAARRFIGYGYSGSILRQHVIDNTPLRVTVS